MDQEQARQLLQTALATYIRKIAFMDIIRME